MELKSINMKISFTTLSCPDWSWDKIVSEAVRLGYDGIEIRGIDGEMYIPKATPFIHENIYATIRSLKEKGIKITNLGSGVEFHDMNKFDMYLSEGKEYIDLASKLGVPYVRVFGNKILNPAKREETIELISSGLKQLSDYCMNKNVMCLLETHGDFANVENLMPVLDKVNSPYLGVLWDVEHTFKVYGEDIMEFVDSMVKYIRHVHIKDTKKGVDCFKLCKIGEGDIPIPRIIDVLNNNGYDGYLSLEWEKKYNPHLEEPEMIIPAYIDYIKKYLGK